MITAVADSCSVRLDVVNRKVYKFRALVFRQDSKGNNKEAYLNRETSSKTEVTQAPVTRGILSQQPKTEWKSVHGELPNKAKGPGKNEELPSGPTRKRSKTSQDISDDCETLKKERQKVRFKETEKTLNQLETPACPKCLQVIAQETKDYDCLMEKSKEELVAMLINLKTQFNTKTRKNGYSPTDSDVDQLMQLDISNEVHSPPKLTKSQSTPRRRPSRTNRLTSI